MLYSCKSYRWSVVHTTREWELLLALSHASCTNPVMPIMAFIIVEVTRNEHQEDAAGRREGCASYEYR